MDELFADTPSGLLTSSQLERLGVPRFTVARAARTGAIVSLTRGVYTTGDRFAEATADGDSAMHLLRTKAQLLATQGRAAASHHSGALVHGLPVWGFDLGPVHLTRLRDLQSRRRGEVRIHQRERQQPIVDHEGNLTVSVGDCVVGVGLGSGTPVARTTAFLIAADAALARGVVDRDALAAAVDRYARHRAIPQIRQALAWVDGRHESPGETRLGIVLRTIGWASTPQVSHVIEGQVVRTDVELDDYPVAIEFDGRVKYGWGLPNPTPAQLRHALMLEKHREDLLRSIGYEVVRVTWEELGNPALLASRINAAIRRCQARGRAA